MELKNKIEELNKKLKDLSPEEIIKTIYEEFGERVTFATSLGQEDQIITDMISKAVPKMSIFTLDTGRLFQESYELIAKTQKRYPMPFNIYYPNTEAVENMVKEKGIDLFYESVENRKTCCGIRKVEPLQRALKNVDVWIVGLRRAQSITRAQLEVVEWDEGNNKIKISPLAHWGMKEVEAYVSKHKLDISPLHAQGFLSIGCAPCTRAVKPGEDERAGRWWWEEPESKECGLHKQ